MAGSGVPSFESEIRTLSPRPVLAVLLFLGAGIILARDNLPDPWKALDFALFLYALGATAWALSAWKPRLGRWFTVAALAAIIQLVESWLGVRGFLSLMAIPTALAAVLIGLPAAAATAVAETVLLALLEVRVGGANMAGTGVALLGVWATLAMMYAVYAPVRHLARWSWGYYRHAQDLLEVARADRARLKQALEDLAHANRQLAATNERLAAARLVAEEAQKAKAAFVARVSHEFRTPLNMIIGLTDLLLETPDVYGRDLPPTLLEDLEIVHRNCEHLAGLINDVLDLSQVEAGRLALRKERVNLEEAIDRALAVVQPLIEKKRLSLRVEIPPNLAEVYCDRTRIRQVIVNLLSNAARFTEAGGIAVRVVQQEQSVTVSVADTGPGIATEDSRRIFEPFYQGAHTTRRTQEGSGLGLSISKQFVELHDGQMWLESALGVGTTFYFRLPISPAIVPTPGPERWLAPGWTWVERTSRANLPVGPVRPRIVVCDEAGELCPLLARYTDEAEFVETKGLEQAVQELRRCTAQAILLNTTLPERLYAVLEQARAEIGDTPIIGFSLPPRAGQALAAGAVAYLPKPITRAELQRVLDGLGSPVRRVLVVDDEADTCRLFARMLHACDETMEVITTANGRDALAEMRASPPDLILLDIALPDLDGWQLLQIRSQEDTMRDIPVVIISGGDPREVPVASKVFVATMGEGLSIGRLLQCSREVTRILLQPARAPDPEPG